MWLEIFGGFCEEQVDFLLKTLGISREISKNMKNGLTFENISIN